MSLLRSVRSSPPGLLVRRMARIAGGPLADPIKKKALSTEFKNFLRGLTLDRHAEVTCPILDFQMSAYSFDILEYLFGEVFVELDYFFETSQPAPFIIDCGSNIGMSILFFKSLFPEATIIGFEPATDSFTLLNRNIQANGLKNVSVHQAAVGQTDGKVSFFCDDQAASLRASTNTNRSSATEVSVEQVRLSRFIDREVDFLKLDVEGAENGVMEDLVSSGRLRNIAQMVVEYHHHIEAKQDCFSSFLGHLEKAGFGYQLRSKLLPRKPRGEFQDVLVYAYRKD